MDLSRQRREYETAGLEPSDLDPDPFVQFARWMDDAQASGTAEPTAVVLSTADARGRPSARAVLLKGISHGGFVVFTNYDSRKGRESAVNPWGAMTFVWLELSRQVRIEGHLERVAPDESDAYFDSRPRGSQIGAWASPQSQPIADRAELDRYVVETTTRFADGAVPRPPNWGGLRLVPVAIELWQGRGSRLHDRLVYLPAEGEPVPEPGAESRVDRWRIERRAP